MKRLLLVSVKEKNGQASGKIYAIGEDSIGEFIAKNLTSNVVILIDTVDTFVSTEYL